MNPTGRAQVGNGTIPEPGRDCAGLRPRCSLFFLVGHWAPRVALLALLLCGTGLFLGLHVAPHATPGGLYRIIFIHAPAAWVSLAIFALVAVFAAAGASMRWRMPAMAAQSLAPTGAMFALIAFWTGTLWGRQSSRTWWDVHLALELVLFLLFVAIILFRAALEDTGWADRVTGVIALAGFACVPVVMGSWSHLPVMHRFLTSSQPAADALPVPVAALATITTGFALYAVAVALLRLRCVILERDRNSEWVERHTGGLR